LQRVLKQTKPGQDVIFCEGSCDTWLHRKCAGLSKSVFSNLDKNVPYICPHCRLQAQENEIKTLKTAVDMLTKIVNELKAKLRPAVDSNNASQPADLICLGHPAPVTTAALINLLKKKFPKQTASLTSLFLGSKNVPKALPNWTILKKILTVWLTFFILWILISTSKTFVTVSD